MTVQQHKQAIRAGAALAGGAAAVVWLAGFLLPVRVAVEDGRGGRPIAAAATAPGAPDLVAARQAAEAELAELQRLCAIDLRRPLNAPAGDLAGAGALNLRLVGTIVEDGHSVAILQKADGAVEMCPLGQSVHDAGGPVTVTAVSADRVTVRCGGVVRELVLPPPAGAGGGP